MAEEQDKIVAVPVDKIEEALAQLTLELSDLEAMEQAAQQSEGKVNLTDSQIKILGQQLSVACSAWPTQGVK